MTSPAQRRSLAGEEEALARRAARLPPPPAGEVWIGDDAAVLAGDRGPLLFATDLVAEGVHFDRRLSSLADVGWKLLAANLSDIAAMGGRPLRCVVALAGGLGDDLDALYDGLGEAATAFSCPVVGGDLSAPPLGGGLCVSLAVLGTTDGRPPVTRAGGRPGDAVLVSGPLGAAAAGLRLLRADPAAEGPAVAAHRRPVPRLAAGRAAAVAGARAMIDVSDGLGLDLDRLARASGVGVELDTVPTAPEASEAEALGGGEDYELVVALADPGALVAAHAAAGLAPPIEIGRLVADPSRRRLQEAPLPIAGWRHRAGV